MRILYDARSVRTPAGRYVFHGLTTAWSRDPRVAEVLAAIPPDFDRGTLPDGVTPVPLRATSWLEHVRGELPARADAVHADVIFSPNGFPPRDPRAVIYFQDMYHFRLRPSPGVSARDHVGNIVRAHWRARAAPACMLAVPVSQHVRREVEKRLDIPVVTIPNGVDVAGDRWRGGDDRVLVMGGSGSRKGEATAVRAWADVFRAGGAARTVLEVCGVEPRGRRSELAALASQLGVAHRLVVTGALPRAEFLERIAGARLAVSCSTLEAFGLPVAEALALGAPVLCTDIPSHAELVARAGAGELFAVGDDAALAERLGRSLAGSAPPRLTAPPAGWSWAARAAEHLDAYVRFGAPAPMSAAPEGVHVRD